MDSVHGRKACLRGRAAAVFAERPAGTAETVGVPMVTSPFGALRRPPALTPNRKAVVAAQRTQRFVDSFYHQNGNCGAVVIARRRARHSAAAA